MTSSSGSGAPPRVVRLGWTPVRATRWLSASEVNVDAGGVSGDRAWSPVDTDLDALRAAAHPEMMRLVVEPAALPDATPDEPTTEVTYWGRTLPASLHDGPVADRLSALVGQPVRLAHTGRRPGFVWGAPLSVLLLSELGDLPHDLSGDVDRYRANIVVDDLASPLDPVPGGTLRVGEVELRVVDPIDRCIVIDHEPTSGRRDARLMPRLRPGALLGWGCTARVRGRLRVGDPVEAG